MKILLKLVVAACICLSFPSCKFLSGKNAVKFNDTLVKMNQMITERGKTWGDSLGHCDLNGSYANLAGLRQKIEREIDGYIDAVKKMEPVGDGGGAFKDEEIVFLRLERRVIHDGFGPFETLTGESTAEQKQVVYDGFTKLVKEEEVGLGRLKKEQERYAKANNISLEFKTLTH
jgi:hypothetical protein